LLFLYYYADFTKEKKYTRLAEKVFDQLLAQLESNLAGFSYSNGYAGILYLFHFLQEKKFISLNFSDFEETIESYLINHARSCMQVNDYDYLHGSLGVALYFSKKNPSHPFLSEFVEFIYHSAEKDSLNHTVKWKTPYGRDHVYDYYLSLSHGMTSMVLFLCQLLKSASFSMSDKCLAMLKGCMNYILLQEIDHTQYGSFFPNSSLENNPVPVKSRVAWCFGDTGTAWALWQAGVAVNNRQWQDKAITIMKHAARRVNWEQTLVNDCGLCHGSAGIGLALLSFIRNDLQEWDELFLLS